VKMPIMIFILILLTN